MITIYLQTPAIYNASKAAVHLYSETLRLELAPLDVKVLTIVTGMVVSSFKANVPAPELPPDSRYLPVKKNLEAIASGSTIKGAMPSDKYAGEVVADVLGGASGKVWRGGSAGLAKLAKSWFPTWLIVSLCHVSSVVDEGLIGCVGPPFDGWYGAERAADIGEVGYLSAGTML
jgi:hypothetical protein